MTKRRVRLTLEDVVPKKYWATVRRSFKEAPLIKVLATELMVYRFWGGGAVETGSPWFTATRYVRATNARRFLALPESNTAEGVTIFRIPAGTTILKGRAAAQVGVEGFASGAVGGGLQVYLPEPHKAIRIGVRR